MMTADDMTALLHDRDQVKKSGIEQMKKNRQWTTLQSRKSAGLADLMAMVKRITEQVFEKGTVVFIPDEGGRIISDPKAPLDKAYILYRLISRTPREIKPRVRDSVEEAGNFADKRQGTVYGQLFDCLLQFDIAACDYITADSVMNTFEEILFSYSGYFKSNGIGELIFQQQFTDRTLDVCREKVSIRSLQYRCFIEKLMVVFDPRIEAISAVNSNEKDGGKV